MGADVLRLWVISEDYRNDVAASTEIFKQMMESYRRIRNTMRFLLGNLTDFDPALHTVAPEKRSELDRWALDSAAELIDRIVEAYEKYEFNRIYHLVHQYCVVTMSALYLDILKDRLYCSAPGDEVRPLRAKHTLRHIHHLDRPPRPRPSLHLRRSLSTRPPAPRQHPPRRLPQSLRELARPPLREKWARFAELREIVMRPLEDARRAKTIGKSLDALVVLKPKSKKLAQFITENVDLLRDFFIVSQCVIDASGASDDTPDEPVAEALEVEVSKAPGEKCARCWVFAPEVGHDQHHPSLCRRCADVVRRVM